VLKRTIENASKPLLIGLSVASAAGVLLGVISWFAIERERRIDLDDFDRRAHAVAFQISHQVRECLSLPDAEIAAELTSRLEGHRRLIGFAVFRPDANLAVAGSGVVEYAELLRDSVDSAISESREHTSLIHSDGVSLHALATPIYADTGTLYGVLATVHNMTHLDDRAVIRRFVYSSFVIGTLSVLMALFAGAVRATYERPLQQLADWMRRLRVYNAGDEPPRGLPVAILSVESSQLAKSFRSIRASRMAESRSHHAS
jgi:hypothetical protein